MPKVGPPPKKENDVCVCVYITHTNLGGVAINLIRLNFFVCLFVFRAAPSAFGGSQARGLIGAVAASLHHSHSKVGSEPHLRPIPQLMATPDP